MAQHPPNPQVDDSSGDPEVKLFAALLHREDEALEAACALLGEAFSPLDFRGAAHPFDRTDYYAAEMGAGLRRTLVSFTALVPPPALVAAKLGAARVEDALRDDAGNRTVNVDVGYLDLFKVVLASFKERGQKLYLGGKVWADLVLTYQGGRFQGLPWTFPDFRPGAGDGPGPYDEELRAMRELYKAQLRDAGP